MRTPRAWQIDKAPIRGEHGVVVSQHALASRAGAAVLEEGGNAVDAVVTTALAMGVLEPWLSGIGGGGFLLTYDAGTRSVAALDFGMQTPRNLDPGRYPLVEGDGGRGLFGWPAVVDDRNLYGFDAMCVPGSIDGLGQALETFGTIPWVRALEPAIAFAREGLAVDWYATLSIATSAADLARDAPTARTFLDGGHPPLAGLGEEDRHLPLDRLAETLHALAHNGYRDFYEGEVARSIVADLTAGGATIDAHDLRAYRATRVDPLALAFGTETLHAMPGLSGGPSYLEAMGELDASLPVEAEPGPATYRAMAHAIRNAYDTRMRTMGAGAHAESCTTHVSVIDGNGNMASLTNTLLARFGSKIMLQESGVLMNNGLMWFDPRPGRPNSIRPNVRPLANMCPVLITRRGAPVAALGAAGGRRIMPALVQITSFLTRFGMDARAVGSWPRIDASGATIVADERLPPEVLAALARSFPVKVVRDDVYPVQFAVPSIAMIDDDMFVGVAHSRLPWPGAAAATDRPRGRDAKETT